METSSSSSNKVMDDDQSMISIKVLHARLNKDRISSSNLVFMTEKKYYTEIEWIRSSGNNCILNTSLSSIDGNNNIDNVSPQVSETPQSIAYSKKEKKNNTVIWDYFCNPFPWLDDDNDGIIIRVFSSNPNSNAYNLYASSEHIPIKELLESNLNNNETILSNEEVWLSPEINIALKEEVDGQGCSNKSNNNNNNESGESLIIITIQACLIPIKYGIPNQYIWNDGQFLEVTLQKRNNFQQPVKKVGVSGGTAAFFHLNLKKGPNTMSCNKSKTYYIGKDLSHAVNEVTFYEEILKLRSLSNITTREQRHYQPLLNLFKFSLEYAGVLTALDEDNNNRNLLVLRNLFDNTTKLRLIDLKIGERTASAGWKGKKRANAFRQTLFDQITNSKCEGFRLEGFESPPETINSILPKLDAYYSKMNNIVQTVCCKINKVSTEEDGVLNSIEKEDASSSDFVKKTLKVLFQTLNGSDIFMHFLDLHQQQFHNYTTLNDHKKPEDYYTPDEYTEIIMHQIVQTLLQITIACYQVTIPQKWVGSSLAIGYDVATLPHVSQSEEQIRSSVKVHLFDFGRSELTTHTPDAKIINDNNVVDSTSTTNKTKKNNEADDRMTFWNYYKGAILQIFWSAAKSYVCRFGNIDHCEQIVITVCKLYAGMEEHHLGQLEVPLVPTNLTSSSILARNSKIEVGTVQYSIEWRPNNRNTSRLKGSWNIHILKANIHQRKSSTLRKMVTVPPNLYCVITATNSNNDSLSFDQVSSMKSNTYNPIWNETFTIPIVKSNQIKEAISLSSSHVTTNNNDEVECVLKLLNESNHSHQYRFLPTTGKFPTFSSKSTEESEMDTLTKLLNSLASS